MSPLADPFVWFILALTVIVGGVVYAVDTYGRAPPDEDNPTHDDH